ncbi:hypothetical protein PGH45_19140 [Legionella pneumophila]|nr:hypothetical protein [Legionella pneumophila]
MFKFRGGGQLGIPYGTAQYPDCRGLTPEELKRINFASLDLSPSRKSWWLAWSCLRMILLNRPTNPILND